MGGRRGGAYLRLGRGNFLFHDKSRRDQTDESFADCALRKAEVRIKGDDPSMTDACQYDESDYNYLHRRWEERGWHYWYEHTENGHTLILSDDSTDAAPIDGERSDLPFQSAARATEADALGEWTPLRPRRPGRVALAALHANNPAP